MLAQGNALGTGSNVENSHALKGAQQLCGQESRLALSGLGGFSFGSDPQGVALGFPVSAPTF